METNTQFQQMIKIHSDLMSELMKENMPVEKLLQKLLDSLGTIYPKAKTAIVLYDSYRNQLYKPVSFQIPDLYAQVLDNMVLEDESGLHRQAVLSRSKIELNINQLAVSDKIKSWIKAEKLEKAHAIPLITEKGQICGFFTYCTAKQKELTAIQEEVVNIYANLAKLMIEKKKNDEYVHLLNTVIENSSVVAIRWAAQDGWPVTHVTNNIDQFGYPAEVYLTGELVFQDLIVEDDQSRIKAEVDDYIERGISEYEQEYRIRTKSGAIRWVTDRTIVNRDEAGHVIDIEGVLIDITERKEIENEHKHYAHYDPLTNLPNRRYFNAIFKSKIKTAAAAGEKFALLYLDSDNLKVVNDHLGHEAGDAFLKAFSSSLLESVRKGDVVARVGGDEFNVLIHDIEGKQSVEDVVKRIKQNVQTWTYNGQTFNASCSIGIALFPDDGDDEIRLTQCADKAMYEAKRAGKNQYLFYN